MKILFITLLLKFLFFNLSGQSKDFLPATADSIFYSEGHLFKYRGLDYESARALKKVLNLNPNSELYESSQAYMRTKRWMTTLEIIGVGSVGATFDGLGVPEGEVNPIPLFVGLASLGSSLLLWKKSRRQIRNFVDDYNHAVYNKYIQDRFTNIRIIPASQINVGFTLKF